ncbi:Sodium/hydrogen exchanger family-domain-containing protein [Phascolomyces articulosus]|uniref:Sodium/hydrogen exchanger family-domain-containing protein n=1 Tax=Phascolomyces articulosus TaxID=60185 RepID=A0AAD5PGY5_9FUNG|nr:Sodium/hydrogen exchanger family-domain-containing protein [Phascolomyces articulosus]
MPVNLIPGEFSQFTIAVAVLSGFIVFFGYVSMFLKERLFLSEAFVALLVGIIAGPLVSNGINPYGWDNNDEITKQLTRCIIAIQVMAVGIELPKHYLKKEWLTMFMLLFPVMLFMWLVSGLFIYLLLESLVIAACICPTDPILANSVVKGRFAEKHVPAHIRNALSAESGANDGLGFPFLFLAIFLLGEDNVGVAIGKWIYETCLFQIALSCIIGIVVGYVARKMLQWSERHHLIDKPSFLSFAIALSLFLMSMTGFSGSDDVLACFAAGNAFSWDDWFRKETEEAHFQDVIDMMLNLAIFVYIGAIIPWWSFHDPNLGLTPWRLVVIAILILVFRRLPVVLLLKPVMPAMKTYREAVFSGWFGPMGVGAVFLSKIAKEEMEQVYPTAEGQPLPVATQIINPVVLFIVMSSVFVHGTTIPLFKLGKRIRSRTLSFASTSSNPMIMRIPKLASGGGNGRSGRRHHHHHHPSSRSRTQNSPDSSMTETERNTKINTPHPRHHHDSESSEETTIIQPDYTIDMQQADSSDIPEEEFLPPDENDPYLHPHGHHPPMTTTRPSTPSTPLESQIRFVEPVKPQTPQQNEITSANSQHQPHKKNWLDRSHHHRSHASEDESSHPPKSSNNSTSKFHIFRGKHKKALPPQSEKEPEKQSNTRAEKAYHISSTPGIEVWEEDNNVIIEDTQESTPPIVINKTQQPNWREIVKRTVQEKQRILRGESPDVTTHSDESFSSSSTATSANNSHINNLDDVENNNPS